jgi:hypothetical protein
MSLGAVTPEPMALLRASPGLPLVDGQKRGKPIALGNTPA